MLPNLPRRPFPNIHGKSSCPDSRKEMFASHGYAYSRDDGAGLWAVRVCPDLSRVCAHCFPFLCRAVMPNNAKNT